MPVEKSALASGDASVEKPVHAKSGWPMLLLVFVLTAACIACIVVGVTMAPPDDVPIVTGTQTLGIVLLVVGIVFLCVGPLLLFMGFFTI